MSGLCGISDKARCSHSRDHWYKSCLGTLEDFFLPLKASHSKSSPNKISYKNEGRGKEQEK